MHGNQTSSTISSFRLQKPKFKPKNPIVGSYNTIPSTSNPNHNPSNLIITSKPQHNLKNPNPTMEKQSKQKKNKKTSNPKTFSKCRSLSESSVLKPVNLLNNSPRNLMRSLQHKRSSPEFRFGWKIRTNDLAVEEILRDRQDAIRTGKLKGRRLFEDTDGESICSYDNEIENKSNSGSGLGSDSDSGSFVCDKCMEKEVVAVEGEKGVVVVGGIKGEEKGIRVRDFKGLFAIGLSVCVIGVIGVWGFWSYGDIDDQVMFLVPT